MHSHLILPLFLLFVPVVIFAQFPPAAGQAGSTAVPANSSELIAWANHCVVERGWQDISDPDLGFVTVGEADFAINPADNIVVSLGDAGIATLSFDKPITDKVGWDFAVFENAFNDTFLELAFVEVSSDGIHFVRFPATSLTDTLLPVGTFGEVDATKINNLAGKYRASFGTPFDLSELANTPDLDIKNITHVKIIDAIGTLDNAYAMLDAAGRKINDPYPTPYPSSGFDLDAVGVRHQKTETDISENQFSTEIQIFPNPIEQGQMLQMEMPRFFQNYTLTLFTPLGQVVLSQDISENKQALSIENLKTGVYLGLVQGDSFQHSFKMIVK